jgi:phage terminase Nu1 subunit (DNA packaging protein)
MSAERNYPLPQGVDDAVLNRGQLARALNVSEPTIDRWIADAMPVLEGGSNGRPYKFQLSACWAWKCGRDQDEQILSAESERAVQQMRLALIGGSVGDNERVLSPKDRAQLYEEEYRWMQAARARGELIPFQDVVDLFEEVFAVIRDGVVALPDRLQRECHLQGGQCERAVTACDDVLAEAHRRSEDAFVKLKMASRMTNGRATALN